MFGGGVTEHRLLGAGGWAQALPDALPEEATLPKALLGVPLVDEQRYWHATALSAFGILYHKEAIAQRGLPVPRTWKDLAMPPYYGWVAMADPTRSGSNRFCLGLILQRYGWIKGWGLILRMAANSRVLLPSSSDVIGDVASGMCLAGLSVNFTALREIALQGEDRLGFVSPSDALAITPALTTILNCGSNPEIAKRFLAYSFSEEGQSLWALRGGLAGAGEDWDTGAIRQTLFRYPIMPSVYERFGDDLAVQGNPFRLQSDFKLDMDLEAKQAKIIAPLLVAACGENHVLLQQVWAKIIERGAPNLATKQLTLPPFDEQTAYELGARYAQGGEEAESLAKEWSAMFRSHYEQMLKSLGD
jgi:ABC-type Fe3+ transport system substrate-binding protein